jgi:hypothetical protein
MGRVRGEEVSKSVRGASSVGPEETKARKGHTFEMEIVNEPRGKIDGPTTVTEAEETEEGGEEGRGNEFGVSQLLDVGFTQARRL